MRANFKFSRLPSPEEEDAADSFIIPDRKSPKTITPTNFPRLLQAIEEPKGQKRKFDPVNDDEEELLYSDETGGLIRTEIARRSAGLKALEREF